MSLLHKTKMTDWYLLKDEMRTCAFSLSIFMSLLYTTRNERLEVTQGRDVLPSRFLSSCRSYTQL